MFVVIPHNLRLAPGLHSLPALEFLDIKRWAANCLMPNAFTGAAGPDLTTALNRFRSQRLVCPVAFTPAMKDAVQKYLIITVIARQFADDTGVEIPVSPRVIEVHSNNVV